MSGTIFVGINRMKSSSLDSIVSKTQIPPSKKSKEGTLPETNVAPELVGLADVVSFWEGLLGGAMLVLGRVPVACKCWQDPAPHDIYCFHLWLLNLLISWESESNPCHHLPPTDSIPFWSCLVEVSYWALLLNTEKPVESVKVKVGFPSSKI